VQVFEQHVKRSQPPFAQSLLSAAAALPTPSGSARRGAREATAADNHGYPVQFYTELSDAAIKKSIHRYQRRSSSPSIRSRPVAWACNHLPANRLLEFRVEVKLLSQGAGDSLVITHLEGRVS